MQIEGAKLIFVMNFSELHFFKFASGMPQISQILVLTLKIFPVGRGAGRVCPRTRLESSSFFFFHEQFQAVSNRNDDYGYDYNAYDNMGCICTASDPTCITAQSAETAFFLKSC